MSFDFASLFEALHGCRPYAWQTRLCAEVIEGGWPKVIAAPTGAGKTAVLDIALYHLAREAEASNCKAPRRIVFAVDRRVVVDQAFERAQRIQRQLDSASDGPLREASKRLRHLAGTGNSAGGDASALHVEELRGGLPREDDWARTPLQPTILCTTVDQLGSRLLFRGYGVSPAMAPIHAGLLGNDTLIILDEAHLSAAFAETLTRIESLRSVAEVPLDLPFATTQLTATPRNAEGESIFCLTEEEKSEEAIRRRLKARKPAWLVRVRRTQRKSETASQESLEAQSNDEPTEDEGAGSARPSPTPFVEAAIDLCEELGGAPTIAVVVNRVALARAIHEKLASPATTDADPAEATGHHAILLTGRVRSAERDKLIARYRDRLEGRTKGETPLIVVATQCIEAGADFDFDGLVTQIAPLDALAQRFGRLARSGERDGQLPRAKIIALPADLKARNNDPVYGDRLKATWEWLNARAKAENSSSQEKPSQKGRKRKQHPDIDLGPSALADHIASDPDAAKACCTQAQRPPILRAADLDFWSMTNPAPHPDPHLPLYLHGDPRIEAEVAIIWRADLTEADLEDEERAGEIVAAMPPRSGEALQLPIAAARAFLLGARRSDGADVQERSNETEGAGGSDGRKALRWRGRESQIVAARDIKPGDTLVVPAGYGGCDRFGWLPEGREPIAPVEDIADLAAEPYQKQRAALRLHPNVWPHDGDGDHGGDGDDRDNSEGDNSEGNGAAGGRVPWSRIAAQFADLPKRSRQIDAWIDRLLEAFDHAKADGQGLTQPFEALTQRLRGMKERNGQRLLTPYRIGEGDVPEGVVIVAGAQIVATDDDDASSFAARPQLLEAHAAAVERWVRRFAEVLRLDKAQAEALELAARHHDDGKRDPRFQEFLRSVAGGEAATIADDLAKSGVRASRGAERRLRQAANLPNHWRHEVLSAQLYAQRATAGAEAREVHDLALWLIGTHHGQGRPHFRHRDRWDGIARQVGGETLGAAPGPHQLDFDWHGDAWADLFECLKRRHGFWGLAYLEAVLRLADHRASEEGEGAGDDTTSRR